MLCVDMLSSHVIVAEACAIFAGTCVLACGAVENWFGGILLWKHVCLHMCG